MKTLRHSLLICILSAIPLMSAHTNKDRVELVVLKDPTSDARTGPEILKGPEMLENGGILSNAAEFGFRIRAAHDVEMPQEFEREYGEWNRASLTNRELGKIISTYDKDSVFFIGLLSGSKSAVGMLAGLQHLGPDRAPLKDSRGKDILGLPRLGRSRPLKVGLFWIDSRAAFSTPDNTIEGDMGGMNVAVAAGLSNYTLRIQAGLDPPLSTKHIVMAGVRNTTPYEEFAVDNSFIERIAADDLIRNTARIAAEMERLSRLCDVIYVHVDLSVLDPAEVPGHPAAFPGGPSSGQLAAVLKNLCAYPEVHAVGIASCPEEPQSITLDAARRIVEGALEGVKSR